MAVRCEPTFFSFSKSFFVFLARFFLRSGFLFARRAQLPFFVSGRVPVTSSYSSIGSLAKPMMSCLTVGNRLGRNAPHLTDDSSPNQLQRRTAFHPAVRSNSSGKIVFRFEVKVLGTIRVTRRSSRRPRCSRSSPVRPPWRDRFSSATGRWPVGAPGPRRSFS